MEYINKPYFTKKLKLNNRLVFPPMQSGTPSMKNQVTDAVVKHYAKRAEGGYVGLIIAEHAFVSKDGLASPKQLSIASDTDIEGLKRLTDAVHKDGAKIVAQLSHAGGATTKLFTGMETIGPSKESNYSKLKPNVEMTKDDIRRVTDQFADAAKRAKAAGFDGVEIHSAHGYLLCQFYSPLTNCRRDEYGGTLANRVRFHLEVTAAIRAVVGDDYPILLRLGACDYTQGGSAIEDGAAASKLFESGGVDILDVSGGLCLFTVKGREREQGYFQDSSEAIKQAVDIPVILTGGITDIEAADRLIADGKADLIGVGRPMFADGSWAKKALGGD